MNILKKIHGYTYTVGFSSFLLFALSLSPSLALADENVVLGTGTSFTQQFHGVIQAANSFTLSANHSNTATLTVVFSGALSPTSTVLAQIAGTTGPPIVVSPTTVSSAGWTTSCNNTATFTFSGFSLTSGTTYYVLLKSAGAQTSNSPEVCGSLTGNAFSAGTFIVGTGYTVTSGRGYGASLNFVDIPPPAPDPIGDYVNNSEAGFASTTGFSMGSVISWAGTNLILLFIGNLVGILYSLRFWIAALAIIAGVIYFSFRAFKFNQT